MKYLIVVPDGAGDDPIPSLEGKTPLEAADIPCINELAAKGEVGMVKTIPDGVALTSIKQEGEMLTLSGRSQSNARVSTYMRNLEGSGWMTNPDLTVIEAKEGNSGLPYTFDLKVKLANPNAAKPDDAVVADAAAAAPAEGGQTP